MEDSTPRFALHFGGTSDIFSDAIPEGIIKDAIGVVTVFDNVSGDAGSAEAGMELKRWRKPPFDAFTPNCTIYLHLLNSVQR